MPRLRLAWILALVGLTACADPVSGELTLESRDGHPKTFAPRECVDGDSLGYFGVQFRTGDRILEFFRSDDEPKLAYFAPGDGAFEIDLASCEHFRGALIREYNATGNGRVEGHLEVSCASLDGWSVEGSLSFEQCRAPEDEDCDDNDWDDDDDGEWDWDDNDWND